MRAAYFSSGSFPFLLSFYSNSITLYSSPLLTPQPLYTSLLHPPDIQYFSHPRKMFPLNQDTIHERNHPYPRLSSSHTLICKTNNPLIRPTQKHTRQNKGVYLLYLLQLHFSYIILVWAKHS